MKYFRFALWGMAVMLYLLCSCSFEEPDVEKQVIEKVNKDDAAAGRETPVTGKEKPDGKEGTPVTGEDEPDDEEGTPVTGEEEPDDEEATVTGEGEPDGEEGTPVIGEDDDEEAPESSENAGKLALQINELRTEYSKLRVEFIEFKILSAGNLGGLRVFIASNYKNPLIYEFLPVEVKKGEYIVLHLRTLEEGCKDEYGKDLGESGGTDSSPTARDFWVPGKTEILRKTDVIYVLDQDDQALDAVMIAEKPDAVWPKVSKQDCFTEAAEFLFNQGAWKSADGTIPVPSDAASSASTTYSRTICRDETIKNSRTAADWYVTVSSGATPGQQNNPTRF